MTKARSNATANAAKGDLTVGNGTNLSGVLSVSQNGDTIVADSSTSTGLRYIPATVQANPVLNSAYQVWQRGTSVAITNTSGYTADRWFVHSTGAPVTISRQDTNDTTNLPNIQYCARVQRNSGSTATGEINVTNLFETVNSIPFAGKTVTLSFYARAGANFSYASSILNARIQTGTGTDQNLTLSGYTGSVVAIEGDATLTTTWQRFSFTATLATNIKEMCVYLYGNGVGTAGANDYYEITGVQIDVGSVALPFRTYAGTIQGELAACQRYYYRAVGGNNNSAYAMGSATSTTVVNFIVPLPVTFRTLTSATIDTGNLCISDGVTAASGGTFTSSGVLSSQNIGFVIYTHGSATLTQYRPYRIENNSNNAGYIGFSAEL